MNKRLNIIGLILLILYGLMLYFIGACGYNGFNVPFLLGLCIK